VTALLDEVGYQHLTVEAVAARAGVGRTTVYRWWPTKSALVIDAIAAGVPAVEIGLSGDSRRDLRAVLDRMARTECGPATAETLAALAAEARRDPDTATRLGALLGPRRAADAAVVMAAAAHGDIPHDVDVALLLDVALGTLLWRRLRGEEPTDAVLDALAGVLVGARPGR
jgi:AcrR family transcriptional regulator